VWYIQERSVNLTRILLSFLAAAGFSNSRMTKNTKIDKRVSSEVMTKLTKIGKKLGKKWKKITVTKQRNRVFLKLKAKETKKCRHRDDSPIVTNENTFMLWAVS
jgi:hypothetical protein